MLALLIATAFLEGSGYSFRILGLRVRSVQVLAALFLGVLGLLSLTGKWRWRRSPLDYWLLAFLAVNGIAVFNSRWKARSWKIFFLLVSLALLYWLVFQLQRNAGDVLLSVSVFLAAGLAQVLFGLYQVLAGMANHYLGWSLPIGHMGLAHREFINSVWGRPYGTQVEPDFYGAICMVLALMFLVLYFSGKGKMKRWLLAGALLSLLGLYFSFVRAAWLFFLLAVPLLALGRMKLAFFRFTWTAALFIVGCSLGLYFFAAAAFPPIRQICDTRFAQSSALAGNEARRVPPVAAKSMKGLRGKPAWKYDSTLINGHNIRLILVRQSLRNWGENPVFGNGPGSFAFASWCSQMGEAGAWRMVAENRFPPTNPSMIFTLLEDSGLVGLLLFLAMAVKFLLLNYRRITGAGSTSAPLAFALGVGLMALMLTFVLTNGLWLPLTWVLLGLGVASLERFPSVGETSPRTRAEGDHAHRH
jgi:O-antigen ligase